MCSVSMRYNHPAYHAQDENVVGYLVNRFARPDGSLSVGSKIWTMVLIVTIIFSSVHQT